MKAYYYDETERKIEFDVHDMDALMNVAHTLSSAPIDIECLYLENGEMLIFT